MTVELRLAAKLDYPFLTKMEVPYHWPSPTSLAELDFQFTRSAAESPVLFRGGDECR